MPSSSEEPGKRVDFRGFLGAQLRVVRVACDKYHVTSVLADHVIGVRVLRRDVAPGSSWSDRTTVMAHCVLR